MPLFSYLIISHYNIINDKWILIRYLPGTESSYTSSAGSVFLNFLQMIKGGPTHIAKFPINIFDTNIEHNYDIHNTEESQVHFI